MTRTTLLGIKIHRLYRVVTTAVRNFIVAAWNAIKGAWTQTVNNIRAIVNGLKTLFIAGWDAIKSGATRAWNAIKSAVTGAINSARDKFNSLKSVASGVVSRIRSLFSPGAWVFWWAVEECDREHHPECASLAPGAYKAGCNCWLA